MPNFETTFVDTTLREFTAAMAGSLLKIGPKESAALNALMSPHPVKLFGLVGNTVLSRTGVAVFRRASRTWIGVRSGLAESRSAADPAVRGVENEVPSELR